MNQTNYLKLFSIAAFIVFGGISCWATAESLHLLLATWPKIFCYLVAIGFFVVAAIGTKMIVDSLNQKIYVEGRTGKLICGIILVLIFWLATSMPTNTHTFIYRNVINERVSNDIAVTQGYLSDIIQNKTEKERIESLISHQAAKVESYYRRLVDEINQPNDRGSGDRANRILHEMASELGGEYQIDPIRTKGNSQVEINNAVNYYTQKFNYLIQTVIPNQYARELKSPNKANLNQAITAENNLRILTEAIGNHKIDLNSSEDIHDNVIKPLNSAYQAVNLNKEFVILKETDKHLYDTPIVTETQRMTSIFEVWGDYMSGKFNGHGFFWWILLAVLVDVAAFIFFDIAFKKREY